MKQSDLVGGVIKSIWNDDDNKVVVIISTNEYGLQGFEAYKFKLIQEEEDHYDEDETI